MIVFAVLFISIFGLQCKHFYLGIHFWLSLGFFDFYLGYKKLFCAILSKLMYLLMIDA
jgi:hypothetical protein